MPDIIKKTVIITGYQCNNRCRFCMEANKRDIPNISFSEIKKQMVDARQRGAEYLEMIGGEVTIRPDILEIISFAKNLGFETIMMATNGRMYSYKDFTRKIFQAGLNSLIFSIHGHNAKLHDYLTQAPGSFKQLNKGVKNVKEIIRELGLKRITLGTNTTIVKQNYKYLPQIGQFIYDLGLKNAEFIFVDCNEGSAKDHFDKLVPRISEITPYIHRCLDLKKKYNIPHWDIRYVPLCYFQNYLDQVSEIQEVVTFHTEHIAPDFYNPDAEKGRATIGRKKTKKCKGCEL
ncbi:unnamed protein product, partial [marine sediment metagenome]